MRCLRQGDILLLLVDEIPARALPAPATHHGGRPCLVVAHGERTGHAHALPVDPGVALFHGEDGSSIDFLDVRGAGVELGHEEHRHLSIAAGSYRIVRQRQYDPALAGGLAVTD